MTLENGRHRIVYLLSGVAIAFLAAVNVIIFISAGKAISISFGGSSRISVFDEKLTFIASNNDDSNKAAIWIHGSEPNATTASISFSDLVDNNSGKKISSQEVQRDPNGEIRDIRNTPIKEVKVWVNNPISKTPGVYQGSILITSGANKTSIPFTFDLKPNLGQVVILVVDGIAISIVLWKIIIYSSKKHLNKSLRLQFNDNSDVQKALKAGQLSHVQYANNPEVFNVDKERPWTFQTYVGSAATPETITSETVQIAGTILFGVGVSVLGLLNNSYITNLHDIGIQEVLVLFGIGLGIGSLKDFTQQLRERR
jgi:hypothetical protein